MDVAKANVQFDLGRSLFLKEEFSDVEVIVETGVSAARFPCHKLVLSAASEVFSKMFNSNLSERETGKLIIHDISPDIMVLVLMYICNKHIELDNWKETIDLLRAAHKYQLMSLVRSCEIYLTKNLTLRNVYPSLNASVLYDFTELKTKCLTVCKGIGLAGLKTRYFTELSVSAARHVCNVMQEEILGNEMSVFEALWEWASMECCRKQKILTEENVAAEFSVFCENIRFERMAHSELDLLPKSVLKYVTKQRYKCKVKLKKQYELKPEEMKR